MDSQEEKKKTEKKRNKRAVPMVLGLLPQQDGKNQPENMFC